MKILAIDTSNQVMGVALLNDDVIIGELVTNIKKNHSVQLMPAIDQLMKQTNTSPDMLDKIVVARGPGSFTGIRIGLATAKTLAWALNIPIVGVSSLAALAYQGRFCDAYICPFFDARRSNVYTGLYYWNMNELMIEKEEQNLPMDDWLKQLAKENKQILFLSPDIDLYRDRIMEQMGELAIIPEGTYHLAKPSHAALAGFNKQADNTHTLAPNYLRLAEAEAKWLSAQKEKERNG